MNWVLHAVIAADIFLVDATGELYLVYNYLVRTKGLRPVSRLSQPTTNSDHANGGTYTPNAHLPQRALTAPIEVRDTNRECGNCWW